MQLIHLILKNLFRHKLRTILTVLGIAIAILAFGMIRTVIAMWYSGIEASSPNRLIARNAISLIFPLPIAYRNAIVAVPGVSVVSYAQWFGGIYIDEKHSQFPQIAVDAATWFDVAPENRISESEKAAFLRERNAAVVGVQLARRFGWKIGDVVRMRSMIFSGDWDFVIRGIYTGAQKSTDETFFFFQWRYLDEQIRRLEPWRAGNVGWYVVKIADPNRSASISEAIDRRFKNSLAETRTETEQSFVQGFISMSDAILVALRIISFVIIGVILAVLSNTMAMTARERLSEYAVLKTLGFGARHLVLLIAGESLLIALIGGAAGILLIGPIVDGFGVVMTLTVGAMFPIVGVSPVTRAVSLLMALGVGLAAAIFPAWRAATLRIVEGLRRVG
ncbi:MAG TPA: FtsX-like permease family protein [Nitrospiria bacterium]|nr:FtsX-like permease family protein [Nitrospiria bacterium]